MIPEGASGYSLAAVTAASQYALRFISGKYQGGEFPVRPGREIVIGRSSDLDMVLVEDMVSRRHARIDTTSGRIIIQDLGSTNGTFVNGEKVREMALKEGDRILIGTSIIKMVSVDPASQALSDLDAKQRLEATGQRHRTVPQGKPMSGAIDEIPLPDLIQLLSTSRKSGVLAVTSDLGVGRIYFRKGQIYYGTINDSFDLPPRKALFRLLTWTQGNFELEPPDEKAVLEEITESTSALLVEGMRQIDETRRLEQELPPRTATLTLTQPLQPPLRRLSPVDLDVLQLVHNLGTIGAVLDQCAHTDLDTFGSLKKLLDGGYLAQRR